MENTKENKASDSLTEGLRSVADKYSIEFLDTIEDDKVDTTLLENLPKGFVKTNNIFPLYMDDKGVYVAVPSVDVLYELDDLKSIFTLPIIPILVPVIEITGAINRFYEKVAGTAQDVVDEISEDSLDDISNAFDEPKDLLDLTDDAPIIKLLNSVLFQGVKEKASDIHIEPFEKTLDVRIRKDGVLYTIISPPKVVQEPLISRVKIMAGLDIAEKRLPQDGRIRLLVAGRDIDVRVSIIPTIYGERVVMRILDKKGGLIELQRIGMSEEHIKKVEEILEKPHGIVLVTGPTGSGKSTSLYACLHKIDRKLRNIITVEDPVEYQVHGIGQIQVNQKIGLTFASGLRSILRQDPDVVMVGEIRDKETAEIAIQASLTGHLVLSTLHTNDAPTAISRLIDMGVEPFLVSSSLTAIIAQRLVRILCDDCKEEYTPTSEDKKYFKDDFKGNLFKPKGCAKCFNTGYTGRMGIFEFLDVDSDLRPVILSNPDFTSIKNAALKKGMKSLRDDGLDKVKAGLTSLEEVIRITSME